MYGGLFTQAELAREIEEGFVRSNAHPEADLWILNYTEKAAFDSHWNNVTLNCRGLIVDPFGEIVARPFPKFFNYGQPGCPEIDLDAAAIVSDKMDGSLGILYPDFSEGRYAISTRGSFTSDQAVHATELLKTKYKDFIPLSGFTYLFEIVYPENRIVCDYADMDDLIFLGATDIESGDTYGPGLSYFFRWPGPMAEILPCASMREALEADARSGKEGVVVHLLDSDVRVKIKQEDYIRLHRIVTGLNARSVWQALLDGKLAELIEQIPDEFHGFIHRVADNLLLKANDRYAQVHKAYENIFAGKQDLSRKEFALSAVTTPYRAELFLMHDDKDVFSYIMTNLKPAHDFSPVKGEDA